MSRVTNILKKIINKNHLAMILVLLILIVIPFTANAERKKYSEFDWDAFYEENRDYWTDLCEGSQEADCENRIMKYMKNFYTKLYKLLAKYEDKGLFIRDQIIIETAFFEVFPSHAGNPTSQAEYNRTYSVFGENNKRVAIKIDEEDMDPNIEDDYTTADESTLDAMAQYYENETDTLKVLVKNMIAYYTYCYGSYGEPTVETLKDGSIRKYCPDGGEVTNIILHNTLPKTEKERCAVNLSATTNTPGNELGFWKYYTSRIRYDTLFLGKVIKFFNIEVKDEYRDQCMDQMDAYPDGVYYTYVDQADNNGEHVSTNKYFDFLKTSRYFDSKPHLQDRFKDVLAEANVDCLTNDTCENSLEATGRYDEYQGMLEDDRLYIIAMIIKILNDRGIPVEYDGLGIAAFDNGEYNRAERSGYYWPIGSNETEERDGIVYADGTPAKTMNDVESYFGERKNPITGDKEMHYGIDITTDEGVTNIVAAYDGVVNSIVSNCSSGDYECNEGYGNTVIISHSNTSDYTVYAHLSSIDSQISVGSTVNKGELIGKAGSTGATKTSNLHYELRVGGNTVNNAVDPISNTSAGNHNPPNGEDLRPVGYTGSGIGAISTRFDGTHLTQAEFVSKLTSYCSRHPGAIAREMCNNPDTVYTTSRQYNVNPELVITRAMAEGNSPGESRHNYWGIGCTNTGGINACHVYGSLEAGIQGFASIANRYKNLADMMAKYAYIGKYWYNPGSWSVGGCKYFPYIKSFMSTGRQSVVSGVCSKSSTCTTSGGDCTPTIQEDQDAYTTWQVEQKLGPYMHNVFGT
jgi:murein DD-endopeptidase MepM/ murein hydrolase activator NlpD